MKTLIRALVAIVVAVPSQAQSPAPTLTAARNDPQLACTADPTHDVNKVVFNVSANCLGCSFASQSYGAWNNPAASATVTTPAQLSPKSRASIRLECGKVAPADFRIAYVAANASLAGWGGIAGNYRWALSAVGGTAHTAFNVPRARGKRVCLRVVSRAQQGKRTKGYPGSYLFHEGSFVPDAIHLDSPTGKRVNLPSAGNAVELPESGTWRVSLAYSSDLASSWSEDSGTIEASDEVVLRFTIQRDKCL